MFQKTLDPIPAKANVAFVILVDPKGRMLDAELRPNSDLISLQCIVNGHNIGFAELANASIEKMSFNSILQQVVIE